MFLEKYSEEYLLSLLNEAPNDANQTQTTMQTSNANATYEPQEQDASMGVENNTDGMNMDPGMEEMDMGDGSGQSDPSMGGMDGGMDINGSAAGVNTKDLFKKRKLFKDYKDLLETIQTIKQTATNILSKDLPDDAKKIYFFITHKMDENEEKLILILSEQYFNLSYQQLLTIYMYIKMSVKLFADIIKQLNDTCGKEK